MDKEKRKYFKFQKNHHQKVADELDKKVLKNENLKKIQIDPSILNSFFK